MNVCLLNDSFPPVLDGVANVVMNYGRIMSEELGARVVVGTPRYPDASYDGYSYKVIPYPSLDTTDLVKGYRAGYPFAMREIEQMKAERPDIIHTHCPAASTIVARILQNETKAPIIFTYHSKFDVDITRAVGEGFLKKETIKAMVKNISACDEVWVVSGGAGENLKSLGYTGEYRVMSNGVDFPKGRVDEAKVREVTAPFDLPEGIPVYLFVGRLMKYKGLPIIIDAMHKLSEKGIDYRCILIGGGPDGEEMQELVRTFGIAMDCFSEGKLVSHVDSVGGKPGRILFLGPEHDRERLRAWNTRADLFLFPSSYDTNGIVVREAAACGLASALLTGSCAAEGITHGGNGFLIEESSDAMAELLLKTADNMEKLHDVGQHAMDEIYISWEEAVRSAYNRYAQIHEMAIDGVFARKRKQRSDYLLNTCAMVVKGTEHVFDLPRNLYEGMKENIEELKEDIEELKEDISTKISEKKDE